MSTTGPRIGGLFEGYGGLTMGVQAVLGGTVVWHSEIDPDASRILAHHWPDVPNLGDITKVDWSNVEPVDIITGGSPCQDVSAAGKRQGMRAGTRSGLWASMVDAIDVLRPRLVVWENVRGVTSACAHSELEPCPRCVGGAGPHKPVLRAFGRVLGDLADLGYDAQWHGLRAADIDAPHGRFRVFVVAQPAGSGWTGFDDRASGTATRAGRQRLTGRGAGHAAAADASDIGHQRSRSARNGRPGPADGGGASVANTSGDGRDEGRPESARLIGRSDAALGGDAATDTGRGGWREADTEGRDLVRECSLQAGRDEGSGAHRPDSGAAGAIWGNYAPAIARWERALGRVAPAPTELGAKGGQRLSPRFVEWMMGLPEGHVTDPAIGISRNAQLKALGNGVVPQQATAAVRLLLASITQERAA